jgi:hypothetical protein
MTKNRVNLLLILFGILLGLAAVSYATDYNVGPGQPYTQIGQVPWYNLQCGDNVYIHYQPTPYYEKFMISTRCSAWPGLRVIGVVGPNGELPIIDGNNATTSTNMHWHAGWGAGSGANDIEQGGVISLVANGDTGASPAYTDIENLAVRDCQLAMTFTGEDGVTENYSFFGAAIYAKGPQHLKIVNCEISDSNQGFFNETGDTYDAAAYWESLGEDIEFSGCYFHNNGLYQGGGEHTIYVQSAKTLIEYCRFGPMLPGSVGNQIKSRSAGDVIRYNYMEGEMGGRFLDLVEDQDSNGTIAALPYYGHDFVYGNLFLINHDDANTGSPVIHWDGDHYAGGRATTPGATLYFYNNTWVIDQNTYVNGGMFSVQDAGDDCPSTITGTIDARNNIFYMMDPQGGAGDLWWASCANTNMNFANNWVTGPMAGNCGPGSWGGGVCNGTFTGTQSNFISTGTPNFTDLPNDDVHLTAESPVLGLGAALAPEVTNNTLGGNYTPTL